MILQKMKTISRRQAMSLLGAASVTIVMPSSVFASAQTVSGRIADITSGAEMRDIDIYLDMPDIAENGNQVKVAFEIDSPMTPEDHITTVYILADGNPEPDVARFDFTPAMGVCSATTRMRLSKTQNVMVLAALNDGSFAKAETTVKVTIGGCGG